MVNKVVALFLGVTSWSGDIEISYELTILACNYVNLRVLANSLKS